MPIDQQHPHQARDHIDNGQHLHGQTPETVTFTRIQSISKRNPNNGVFKQQRVLQQANARLPSLLAIKTSPPGKTEQRPTSSSDIVIRRTIGKSLAVRGTIYDQNVSMIVDTAAMITLVNTKLIPADNEDSETVTLRGLGEQLVTGKSKHTMGCVQSAVNRRCYTWARYFGHTVRSDKSEYSYTYHQQQSDKCGIC
ncbi:unnamed protein product [Mytilus coruscus]|uniref:Uncharacterized protein n=1 Tax=Mytilus coruscus TaxID=42192 RepID=A0A6J8BN22_MYTCO|nr:unnamed protein product [Mytilus coruscus]